MFLAHSDLMAEMKAKAAVIFQSIAKREVFCNLKERVTESSRESEAVVMLETKRKGQFLNNL
jgi:hypothetical protein